MPDRSPVPEVCADPASAVGADPAPVVSADPTPVVSADPMPAVSAEPMPAVAADPASGGGPAGAVSTRSVAARLLAVGHRIRSGEDPLAFGAVVVAVAVAAGFAWFWMGAARPADVPAAFAAPPAAADRPFPAAAPAASPPVDGAATTAPPAVLAVHVAGAVARPGLYHLPAGSRVADAVARAGGKLPGGDLDRLNLAARLVDGQKVLVARRGEPLRPDAAGVVGGGGAGVGVPVGGDAAGVAAAEPVDLNTADLAALDSLPGIGPATARAILEERLRRGGFRSPRDLLRVPGIGDGRFARLKDLVRV